MVGLQDHPRDVMFLGHRVLYTADGHMNFIVLNSVNRHMLLSRCVYRVRDQFFHRLAAAEHVARLILDFHDDLTALLAFINLNVHFFLLMDCAGRC